MEGWGSSEWTTKRQPRKFGKKRNLSVSNKSNRDSWTMTIVRTRSKNKDYKTILAERQKLFWVKPLLTLGLTFSVISILTYYFYIKCPQIIAYEQQTISYIDAKQMSYFKDAYDFNIRKGKSHLKSGNYDWAVRDFELALNSQKGDKQLFKNLIIASKKACQTQNKHCEKVKKYDKIYRNLVD